MLEERTATLKNVSIEAFVKSVLVPCQLLGLPLLLLVLLFADRYKAQ